MKLLENDTLVAAICILGIIVMSKFLDPDMREIATLGITGIVAVARIGEGAK